MSGEEQAFFYGKPEELALYQAVRAAILRHEGVEIQVHKTQITFKAKYGFAFVWHPGRRMRGRPGHYVVLSLGLGYRPETQRFVEIAQPYPGRWTCHFILSHPEELDAELLGFVQDAYDFSFR